MSNFSNFSNQYRYILETGSKKHVCPDCNKKSFVRYVDSETGSYLPERYGRCDRESKCSYHLNPYLDGHIKTMIEPEKIVTGVTKVTVPKQKYFRNQTKQQPAPEPVFFDFDTFKQTLQPERYRQNTFIQNLLNNVPYPFEKTDIEKVISLYYLGTVSKGYRAGAVTFPFIDVDGKIRAVQVKQFDQTNHTTSTDFLHSIIEKHYTRNKKPLPEWLTKYTKQEKRITCLFGEHILNKYPSSPVALFEAPKNAIYSWLYLHEKFPDWIYLAVYNKSSFSFEKLKVLQGRFVFVFPDLSKDGNTFKEWETKAKDYESRLPGTRFIFSDLLEKFASQELKNKGADMADAFIELDWRKFREPEPEPINNPDLEFFPDYFSDYSTPVSETQTFFRPDIQEKISTPDWQTEITEIEKYFSCITLPNEPYRLNSWTTINNIPLFIESNISAVKAHPGNPCYKPYFDLLNELKEQLIQNKSN